MNSYNIAVIAGDGIGREVIPQGQRSLERACQLHGVSLNWTEFDWSCEHYATTGEMMPKDGLDKLKNFDAIYLGAVGYPGVPDHISLWGLLLPIRRAFDQYVNLRPVRLFEGVRCPLAGLEPGDIDYLVVRENVEGEYSQIGGMQFEGTDAELVLQQSVFTRKGTDQILKFAFEQAQKRPAKKLASATKSNGIFHSMPYWDKRFETMGKNYPEVQRSQFHIDALVAKQVLSPQSFEVIVGSNLFGDIVSDLGPATTGTIAIAPSANINPERIYPSMFEPIHGSAPDIAGKGIANPIGAIWSGAMMMEHLGEAKVHDSIMDAVTLALRNANSLTPDMGGQANTKTLGKTIAELIGKTTYAETNRHKVSPEGTYRPIIRNTGLCERGLGELS